ncbi:hypothetical protein Sme01_35720 [Sphaerisporangium melleum]|uniref:FtsH ternary system domain-containing protein n=1 Tax=Sphaerisporangium melleum TaxID=321316 RepID=A0A917RAE5_9ACTN|nr:hypothetical protein [Sphaerisporangium melleum]GGK97248.1 hypothetical protein GCM10007964_44370 [Sphaerisporangium melleum]GII71096.1 hypothetical protein Sme01_35720 [Sphaerisporangium melleum]
MTIPFPGSASLGDGDGDGSPRAGDSPPFYARFSTASAALVYAGQVHRAEELGTARCLRGEGAWWLPVHLSLRAARDSVPSCGGALYAEHDGLLVRDRGWGEAPARGTGPERASLAPVPLAEVVRTAGLTATPPAAVAQVTVLASGTRLADLIRRALDLRLTVAYQRVELTPLFADGPARPAYAVDLAAAPGDVPPSLIAALERDPFVLVCRRAADDLLVQHRQASPLPDRALAALVDHGVWVLATGGHGCARLTAHGERLPGTAFVRLGRDVPLTPMDPGAEWPDTLPEPPEVTVVPARGHGQRVDAVLLSDEALACLPLVLEGRTLAETARLVRGRDRHLLIAPGGLLEDLPVGEPLHCLGPGQLYLPLGHRLRPLLPPAARRELFPALGGDAIVLTATGGHAFALSQAVPAWYLWAGEPPEIDVQLPPGVERTLRLVDHELMPETGGGERQTARRSSFLPRFTPPRPFRTRRGANTPTSINRPGWQEEAWALEQAGDLRRAAELHNRNNQPLQAARLYERAAELEERP